MTRHIEQACAPIAGVEPVFYVHGCESLRTYLGKSKFHLREDCSALDGKVLMKDWIRDISESSLCKKCGTTK